MNNTNPFIAVTHGDTNGIGYELILKSFSDAAVLEMLTPVVYGSPKVAAYHRNAIDVPANFSIVSQFDEARTGRFNLLTAIADEVKVELGIPSSTAGHAAFVAMERAVADVKDGKAAALVLAPADNSTMQGPEYQFRSAKAYLETACGMPGDALLMHVVDDLRIAVLADSRPMNEVAACVGTDNIRKKIRLLHQSLCRDFNIDSPRIAVLALNGNDSNGQFFGSEEREIIRPAVEELAAEGKLVYGPFSPDDVFPHVNKGSYDAVLAMYDSQATTALRLLTDHDGYTFIAGLPMVAVQVDHSVDYASAGRNGNDALPLLTSLYGAVDISRNRRQYDDAHSNPLPKLFHERRDEGEKVRFTIPRNIQQEQQQTGADAEQQQ